MHDRVPLCQMHIFSCSAHRTRSLPVPYGLVVRIPAFHAGGPGSIPGVGGVLREICVSYLPPWLLEHIQAFRVQQAASDGVRSDG